MNISRISMISLGVADLVKAARFYEAVFGIAPNKSYEGIKFFELPGTWLTLYPLDELAKDISPEVPIERRGFSGFTLAHNVRSPEKVTAVVGRARAAGARVMKEPQETSWGGFSGYFADPDNYYWEVAWGPMFGFTEDGQLRFPENI